MTLGRIFRLGALGLVFPLLALGDAPTDLQTPYHTEQEWIVSSICRNAFELLAYAKDKKGEAVTPDKVTLRPVSGDVLTYDVTVHGAHVTAEATLHWPGSIWAPDAYVPFCQAVAKALQLPAPAAAQAQGNPLHELLDFSETAIEAENHRVSQWLATEPDNAVAQEQAALILGTLAMKENSGYFWDPRDICNHVCTHLAVAKFLRGNAPTSVEGRLADICVGLIVDTKTQTGADLDALAKEKDAPADLTAWINAGRMRNSRDWRIVPKPETATPLEQVEYLRALGEAVNSDAMVTWLQAHAMPNRIDYTRIVLEEAYSVDGGHAFAEKSIGFELHTMQTTFPGSFTQTSLVGDLNEPPGDAVIFNGSTGAPAVISRGMWAQFFQRHLLHAIAETGDFYANKWSVPENAQALDQKIDPIFSGLTLWPYLQLAQFSMRHTEADPVAGLALFRTHPEWAPDCLFWIKLPDTAEAVQLKQSARSWFSPPVVQGTAYGAMSRAPEGGWDKAEVERLYALGPLQIRVAEMELDQLYGKKFTYAQFQQVMGPLLDYNVMAISDAQGATGLTADQQLELLQKSAAINPEGYFYVARFYVDHHDDEKAADAYQKWYDRATDRVAVSNSMGWLVDYDYDHGKQDQALAIAQAGAEVYSYDGLEIMMHLQEKMGHDADAESYGQKIMERYNGAAPLAGFYKRHADKGEDRYQAKFDDLALQAFPTGLKKVTLASFSGEPSTGMKFTSTSGSMRTAGLSSDQVIVALDGYAVQSEAQYLFVRGLSDSPDMKFVVWDGTTYREIDAKMPGRRFGVDMSDYAKK